MIRSWKMRGLGKGVVLIKLNTGPNNSVVEVKFNTGQVSTLKE